jgi:hypothetical protein
MAAAGVATGTSGAGALAAAEGDAQVMGQVATDGLGYSARAHVSALGAAGVGWGLIGFGAGGFASAEATQLGPITDAQAASWTPQAPAPLSPGTLNGVSGVGLAGQVAVLTPWFGARLGGGADLLSNMPTRSRVDVDVSVPIEAVMPGFSVGGRLQWINYDSTASYMQGVLLVGWSALVPAK